MLIVTKIMSYVNKKTRAFLRRGDIKLERKRSESRLKRYPSAIDVRAWCDIVEDRRQHILELIFKGTEKCTGKLIPLEAIMNALKNLSNENVGVVKSAHDKAARVKAAHDKAPSILGTYKVTTEGPAKVTTRIKGLQPGVQIGGKTAGTITTRAQGSSRAKATIKNVYPDGNVGRGGISPVPSSTPYTEQSVTPYATPSTPPYADTSVTPAATPIAIPPVTPEATPTAIPPVAPAAIPPVTSAATPTAIPPVTPAATQPVTSAATPPVTPAATPTPITPVTPAAIPAVTSAATPPVTPTAITPVTPAAIPAVTSAAIPPVTSAVISLVTPAPTPAATLAAMSPVTPAAIPQITSATPSAIPSAIPSVISSEIVSVTMSEIPSVTISSVTPYAIPSVTPYTIPSEVPPATPYAASSAIPSATPSAVPSAVPSAAPSVAPSAATSAAPSITPYITSSAIPSAVVPADKDSKFSTSFTNEISDIPLTQETPKKIGISEGPAKSVEPPVTTITGDKLGIIEDVKKSPSREPLSTIEEAPVGRQRVTQQQQPFMGTIEEVQEPIFVKEKTYTTSLPLTGDPLRDCDTLRIQLEQQNVMMETLKIERNGFKDKLDSCLKELENAKSLSSVGTGLISPSCEEDIDALELEIIGMRSEEEAEVIKKEVDVLKKYCMKLKSVENENERLKIERDRLKSKVVTSGIEVESKENIPDMEELHSKLDNLEELTNERDWLANKVQKLEKELLQYRDLPEDVEVYRNRSKMLDSALEERDKMGKKIDQIKDLENELNELRKKAARVDELEEELNYYTKSGINAGIELSKSKSRCACLERELQNVKMERDSMYKRIECMKRETDNLKSKTKEAEMLKLERDRLQISMTELSHIQVQNENLRLKCKCLENAAQERDMYKQKYDEIVAMECQCQIMRSQIEAARDVARERDALVRQVGDLEACICEQEEEIKTLVTQVESLTRNKDEVQSRMKDALSTMRAEVEKKDDLIAASEEKLTSVQAQLKSSIQGVSCETIFLKTRIEELEKELEKSQLEIEILRKQNNINIDVASLKEGSLKEGSLKEGSLKEGSLKEVSLKEGSLKEGSLKEGSLKEGSLKEGSLKEGSLKEGSIELARSEYESISAMKRELEAAQVENKKLQQIASNMVALTGDEHVKRMLKQSECAVRRVVEELGKQYKEWDYLKNSKRREDSIGDGNKIRRSKIKNKNASESESNEKLKQEMDDILREKDKLEKLVQQIQNDKVSCCNQQQLISLRIDYAKLQEELQREIKYRKELENRLNK